jgi:hypothetical protein
MSGAQVAAVALGALALVAACSGRSEPPAGSGPSVEPSATSVAEPTTAVPRATTPPDPEPLASPIAPTGVADLDEDLIEIARFVEAERGHAFREPIRVQLLDDAAFERRVVAASAEEEAVVRAEQERLQALGLLPASADLIEVNRAATREGALGFYEPGSGALVVRGSDLTPFTRSTIAHELTHALDDQLFDLDEVQAAIADDDRAFGLLSLVEGDAEQVGDAYVEAMTPAERARLGVEESRFAEAMDLGALPPSLIEIVESPYERGAELVAHLRAQGGTEALDAAFRDPPPSSEAVLHLARYDERDQPVEVPIPPADGPPVEDGVLGELVLVEMLSAQLAPAEARRAGEGWAGDHFVRWARGDGTSCVRDDLRADDAEELDELADALRRWAARHGAAEVEQPSSGTVRVTACG